MVEGRFHGNGLPDAADLAAVLGGEVGERVAVHLAAGLVAPAHDLASRPSKALRGRLLSVGWRLIAGTDLAPESLAPAAAAMELLHAGSLIVDDIQDGSPRRRGRDSLHRVYGVPASLCTGNWLYFWPLRLIGALGLPKEREHEALKLYCDAIERAHYGQSLDLTLKVDRLPRAEVAELCDAVIDLKTGSITGLAMALGALVAGAAGAPLAAVRHFGRRFGAALQMLDDLGNVHGRLDPAKRFEDLIQRKPTSFWALAARTTDARGYAAFTAAVARLPEDQRPLLAWLDDGGLVAEGARRADELMAAALATLRVDLGLGADDPALAELRRIGEALMHAYD